MFGYEGLGCIYWHMVAKLLLAVQENLFAAEAAGDPPAARLAALYYDVRAGLGFNKTPAVYGAFPTDPYSHTPGHSGAQQPGMTGQVKEEILTRLRFSRAEIDATVSAVANHMVFKDVKEMRVAKLKRFMARDGFDDELELHRVDCTSSHGLLDNYEFVLAKRDEFAAAPLIPPPLVNGHDLMKLGIAPGPRFKQILEAIATLQLEGTLTTRDAAIEWVKENI